MYVKCSIFFILILNCVFARRDLFETKCKRDCNTEEGSFECWNRTTDTFAYGLSTAMTDFCQLILNIGQFSNDNETWYNITRKIISEQIEDYHLVDDVRQLNRSVVEEIVVSVLDKCFHTSPPANLTEPECTLCSATEISQSKNWRFLSIIFISIGGLILIMIFMLYIIDSYQIHRSYAPL